MVYNANQSLPSLCNRSSSPGRHCGRHLGPKQSYITTRDTFTIALQFSVDREGSLEYLVPRGPAGGLKLLEEVVVEPLPQATPHALNQIISNLPANPHGINFAEEPRITSLFYICREFWVALC